MSELAFSEEELRRYAEMMAKLKQEGEETTLILTKLSKENRSLFPVDFLSRGVRKVQEFAESLKETNKDFADGETSVQGYIRRMGRAMEATESYYRTNREGASEFKTTQETSEKALRSTNTAFLEQIESAKTFGELGTNVLGAFATSLAVAGTQMGDFGANVKRMMIQLAQSVVKTAIPMIFSQYLGFLGPFGLPIATGLVAFVNGLLDQAKSEFRHGGLVPADMKAISINEEGSEFVVNSKATQKHMRTLELINAGASEAEVKGSIGGISVLSDAIVLMREAVRTSGSEQRDINGRFSLAPITLQMNGRGFIEGVGRMQSVQIARG